MVSIGKISELNNLFPKIGQQSQSNGYGQSSSGGNGLQARLSAIDNGSFSLGATSSTSAAGATSFKGTSSGSLQSRLEAIGTGELNPKYSEKNLDLLG